MLLRRVKAVFNTKQKSFAEMKPSMFVCRKYTIHHSDYKAMHNWLEIPKVVTLPRFLMEHPVSFMYIHNNYVKILKRRKKNFGGFYWDSCPRSPRDRQSRPNPPQNTKKIYYCKVCTVNNFNQMVQSAPIYSCITFLPI